MASKREEVVFLQWGISCKQLRGITAFWLQGIDLGGKLGGNWTGVNNLQQAEAEVGRCA